MVRVAVKAGVVVAATLVCVAASGSAPAIAMPRSGQTTITEVACSYQASGDTLDVSVRVSWRGKDPSFVNTPIQWDTYNSYSAGFTPTRAESRANTASRTWATDIPATASLLSVQAGPWVDEIGTIVSWTEPVDCTPQP